MASYLLFHMVETKGLEPSTPGLQRSPNRVDVSRCEYRIGPLTCRKVGGPFYVNTGRYWQLWRVLMTKCLHARSASCETTAFAYTPLVLHDYVVVLGAFRILDMPC